MTKPISDKAEIALEYPDKLYVGTFERSSRFEAHLDETGVALTLERPGAEDVRKSIHLHIHFGLFADILRDLAATVGRIPKDDLMHREQLARAVAGLHKALGPGLPLIAAEAGSIPGHGHYFHHLHGRPRHREMRIVGQQSSRGLVRFRLQNRVAANIVFCVGGSACRDLLRLSDGPARV